MCGEATNGIEAIQKAHELSPDMIVADPWLPGANGIILTKQSPQTTSWTKGADFCRTLRLTRWSINFVCAGIKGLVLKTDPVAELINATQAFQQDRLYFSRSVAAAIIGRHLCSKYPPVGYTVKKAPFDT